MAIKSETNKGKIAPGITKLALTIAIEQTGPMQLTARLGDYVTTDGVRYSLTDNVVLNFVSNPISDKFYRVELGTRTNGSVDVIARSRFAADAYPAPPLGWTRLHTLVLYDGEQGRNWEFLVPAGMSDLATVDLYVLTIA